MGQTASKNQRSPAMCPLGTQPQRPILCAEGIAGGGPRSDEANRRAIHTQTVLRFPADGGRTPAAGVGGQPKAGAAADAGDGVGGRVSQAAPISKQPPAQGISLSFARGCDYASRSSVEHGYHLHPVAFGFFVSGRDPGLVQPLCPVLAFVEHAGQWVLPGGVGRGAGRKTAPRVFQQRPRGAIYQSGIFRQAGASGNPGQHGWARAGVRQHFYRTILAEPEIRGSLPQGLPGRNRSPAWSRGVLYLLQPRASASGAHLPYAQGGLPSEGPATRGGGGGRVTRRPSEFNRPPGVFNMNSQVVSLPPDPPQQQLYGEEELV